MSQPYRQDLNWLVTEFTTRVEDVAHAIVVSADGVPLALSAGIPAGGVDTAGCGPECRPALPDGRCARNQRELGLPLRPCCIDTGTCGLGPVPNGAR